MDKWALFDEVDAHLLISTTHRNFNNLFFYVSLSSCLPNSFFFSFLSPPLQLNSSSHFQLCSLDRPWSHPPDRTEIGFLNDPHPWNDSKRKEIIQNTTMDRIPTHSATKPPQPEPRLNKTSSTVLQHVEFTTQHMHIRCHSEHKLRD